MENIDYNTEYDNLTWKEVVSLYEDFGARVIIHNGHVVGFVKDGEEEVWI